MWEGIAAFVLTLVAAGFVFGMGWLTERFSRKE